MVLHTVESVGIQEFKSLSYSTSITLESVLLLGAYRYHFRLEKYNNVCRFLVKRDILEGVQRSQFKNCDVAEVMFQKYKFNPRYYENEGHERCFVEHSWGFEGLFFTFDYPEKYGQEDEIFFMSVLVDDHLTVLADQGKLPVRSLFWFIAFIQEKETIDWVIGV